MKTIKILIVVVFVSAFVFGIYEIIVPNPPVPDPDPNPIVIPDGCDLEWDQQYIDSVYKAIPNGQFQTLEKRRGEMTANYNNVMKGSPKKCKETVDLILRNRYQSRFITMANREFDGKNWPHFPDIRDMNKSLLVELSQGSSELKKIETICKEYSQVASYNKRVKEQSEQRPSTLYAHWDFTNTKNLIDKVPSASSPVDHTMQYNLSRKESVKSILYQGHVSFLESLVRIANTEIANNPTKKHYDYVCEIVTKEIEVFKNRASSIYGRGNLSARKAKELNRELDRFEKLIKNKQR